MPSRDRLIDDDVMPVMVPRNTSRLVPASPERAGRLQAHLFRIARGMKLPDIAPGREPDTRPEPAGFAVHVARAACTLCQGSCCRNGADDAFLDDAALARAGQEIGSQDLETITRLYIERLPAESYEGSCIFHGKQGCALDRSMRSDVCNAYFCGGLQDYLAAAPDTGPAVVIAGEGKDIRTSPVMVPR